MAKHEFVNIATALAPAPPGYVQNATALDDDAKVLSVGCFITNFAESAPILAVSYDGVNFYFAAEFPVAGGVITLPNNFTAPYVRVYMRGGQNGGPILYTVQALTQKAL